MRTRGFRNLWGAVAALCERRDEGKFDSSPVMSVFSAKGAVFNQSLGHRPTKTVKAKSLALKAQFIAALTRAFSARSLGNMKSWGAAPGCHELTLSALNT